MDASAKPIDLAAVLDIVVLGPSETNLLPLWSSLPAWWSDELGSQENETAIRITSPVLLDYLTDAREIWNSPQERSADAIRVQIGGTTPHDMLVEATAIRRKETNLLLLRNIDTSWLRPTLQSARSGLLRNELESVRQRLALDNARADRDAARLKAEQKTRIVANLSHEIRTPLTTILALVAAAQTASVDSRDQYLDVISTAAQEILTLGNNILDLSKLQSDRVNIQATPFSLTALLHGLEIQWQTMASQKGLVFRMETECLPDTVLGDEYRLRQVLSNLLGNAIKFTSEGEISLRVLGTRESRVRFSVQDTGIGISPEDLREIFEPFHQVGQTRLDGAGLGLTIARQIVQHLNGEISAKSRLGEGSIFSFEVDLPTTDPSCGQPSATSDTLAAPCQGLEVLVAEDHTLNRQIIVEMLRAAGAYVTEAKDGEEALEYSRQKKFDVLVVDHQMPRRNGLQVIQAVRNSRNPNATAPAILLTAYLIDELFDQDLPGVQRCLTKPIHSVALTDNIVSVLKAAQ